MVRLQCPRERRPGNGCEGLEKEVTGVLSVMKQVVLVQLISPVRVWDKLLLLLSWV